MGFSIQQPKFRNLNLLTQALTHSSYHGSVPSPRLQETPESDPPNPPDSQGPVFQGSWPGSLNNERLEFLGDAVLNFLAGEFLYKRYPHKSEGELTPLRSALVDGRQLAIFAQKLHLGEQMRLGRGAELQGARENPNLLSSAFEAVVGAYFLDQDSSIEAVRSWIWPLFIAVVEDLAATAPRTNYKSRLQDWALAHQKGIPVYEVIAESGAEHAKKFTVVVKVQGKILGQGQGRRKQTAEKAAAQQALDRLADP